MSLVCLTLNAPHGPWKAHPPYYDLQQPNLLLLPFPSTNPATLGFIMPQTHSAVTPYCDFSISSQTLSLAGNSYVSFKTQLKCPFLLEAFLILTSCQGDATGVHLSPQNPDQVVIRIYLHCP